MRTTILLTTAITALAVVVHLYVLPILFMLCGLVSKLTCSAAFVSQRELKTQHYPEVEEMSPYARFTNTTIDYISKTVTSSIDIPFFGTISTRTARYLNEQLGCQLIQAKQEGEILEAPPLQYKPAISQSSHVWREAEKNQKLERLLDDQFTNKSLATRALLVLHDNEIIAERYANGFHKDVPQLGWSITKSVLSALVGVLQQQNKLHVTDPFIPPEWTHSRNITWDDMLKMSSGLHWKECAGIFSDIVLMLFESFDYGKLAAHKEVKHKPGSHWYYSSGTSSLISRQMRQLFNSDEEYLRFPHEYLFNKIGMHGSVIELDPSGTLAASSYGYFTPRALANFGMLYINDGVWNGERILPKGWVNYTTSPSRGNDHYGAHFWLDNERDHHGLDIPDDLFFAWGAYESYCIIIPSKKLVIIRFSIMPRDAGFRWDWPQFVFDVLSELK
jgi:CubicO group peptidase (beta-lactamase class C family)